MTHPEKPTEDEVAEELVPVVAVIGKLAQGHFEETLTAPGYQEFQEGIATICGAQAAKKGKVLVQVFHSDPKEITRDDQISWIGLELEFTRMGGMTHLQFLNAIVPEHDFNPMIDPDYTGYFHLVITEEQIDWDLFET